MNWFKRKKQKIDNNDNTYVNDATIDSPSATKNLSSSNHKQSNSNYNQVQTKKDTKTLKVTKNFVHEQIDQYGVTPEYFDYEKIKLNKFLTDDDQYRQQILHDANSCNNKKNCKCSCFSKKYNKDMEAINKINHEINTNIELEKQNNLYHARKAYIYDSNMNKKLDQEFNSYQNKQNQNSEQGRDFRGLNQKDYNAIIDNINKQAYKISKETDEMLKQQRTKVLNILNEDNINSAIVNCNDNCLKENLYQDKEYENYKIYKEIEDHTNEINNISKCLLNDRYSSSQINKINQIDNTVNNYINEDEYLNDINQSIENINQNRINTLNKIKNEQKSNINLNTKPLSFKEIVNENDPNINIDLSKNKTNSLISKTINLDNLEPDEDNQHNYRISKNNRRQFKI